jgi:hypothetical protein
MTDITPATEIPLTQPEGETSRMSGGTEPANPIAGQTDEAAPAPTEAAMNAPSRSKMGARKKEPKSGRLGNEQEASDKPDLFTRVLIRDAHLVPPAEAMPEGRRSSGASSVFHRRAHFEAISQPVLLE